MPTDDLRSRDFQNILLIKLSALGDVVHTFPLLNKLRRRYPKARIDWLVVHGARWDGEFINCSGSLRGSGPVRLKPAWRTITNRPGLKTSEARSLRANSRRLGKECGCLSSPSRGASAHLAREAPIQ